MWCTTRTHTRTHELSPTGDEPPSPGHAMLSFSLPKLLVRAEPAQTWRQIQKKGLLSNATGMAGKSRKHHDVSFEWLALNPLGLATIDMQKGLEVRMPYVTASTISTQLQLGDMKRRLSSKQRQGERERRERGSTVWLGVIYPHSPVPLPGGRGKEACVQCPVPPCWRPRKR